MIGSDAIRAATKALHAASGRQNGDETTGNDEHGLVFKGADVGAAAAGVDLAQVVEVAGKSDAAFLGLGVAALDMLDLGEKEELGIEDITKVVLVIARSVWISGIIIGAMAMKQSGEEAEEESGLSEPEQKVLDAVFRTFSDKGYVMANEQEYPGFKAAFDALRKKLGVNP